MATEQVETAVYRLRVEGQEQIDRLTKSIGDLTIAEEKATAETRKTSDELQKRIARYDPLIRAQQAYSKELENIAGFQESGVGTQKEINALFEGATSRYQAAQRAAEGLGEAHKGLSSQGQAAFHSMRSLFEQIALGQSPITALIGQINHLTYAATGEGGIVGAFKGMASGVTSFITPARAAIGAIGAIGAAAVVAASQWLGAQKDIERSLLGIGAKSGATVSSINAFAQGGGLGGGGLSVAERRGIGTEFAKTGELDASKIQGIAEAVEGYATITGTTATEATKALAQALSGDLSKGMQDLSKVFGDFHPTLQDVIDGFLKMHNRGEAVQAIVNALGPDIERAKASLSAWAKTWNFVANQASNAFDIIGEGVAKIATLHLGDVFGGRERRESAAQAAGFEKQATRVRAAGQAAVENVEPQIAQLRKLEQALADVQKAKEGVGATGPIKVIDDQGAEQIIRNQVQALQDAKSEAANYAQYVGAVAASWQGVSQSAAVALQAQEDQLPVINAIGGAAKNAAQEVLDYNNTWNKTGNAIEAATVAAENHKIAVATVNASAAETLWNLQNQLPVLQAITDAEHNRAQEQATINKLKHDEVDATLAVKVAAAERTNAEATQTASARRAARQQEEQQAAAAARQNAANAENAARTAQAADAADALATNMARAAREAAAFGRNMSGVSKWIADQKYVATSFQSRAAGEPGSFEGSAGSRGGGVEIDPSLRQAWEAAQRLGGGPNLSDLVTAAGRGGVQSALNFAMSLQERPAIFAQKMGMLPGGSVAPTGETVQTAGAITEQDIISQVTSLYQTLNQMNPAAQAANTQGEMAWLQGRPTSLAQQQAIATLRQSIEGLTKSTDSLNATNQDLLSPYYTQDPRTSHIGFRSQGMAAGGYVDVPGGYSTNDNLVAQIPVASGERIYVDPMGAKRGVAGGGHTTINISTPILIQGNANKDELGRTLYQSNQALAKQIGAAQAR